MAEKYWVIGGEYQDNAFTVLVAGSAEERIGPFGHYDEALRAWQSRAWATVDNFGRRYRIIAEPTPAPVRRYFVIGGDYSDRGFQTLLPGSEERYGPFATYQAAHECWQARAWATVDNFARRYRIVEEIEA